MQDWIAGVMAVLGTLLVLGGGTVIVLKALAIGTAGETSPDEDATTQALPTTQSLAATNGNRLNSALRRCNAADRLIGWGILLLVLGAVAAGAISFNFGAEAGTQ